MIATRSIAGLELTSAFTKSAKIYRGIVGSKGLLVFDATKRDWIRASSGLLSRGWHLA